MCTCPVAKSYLTVTPGSWPSRLLCLQAFAGKNTGQGCHFLFKGIYPTRGLDTSLLHLLLWQAGSLPLIHLRSPRAVAALCLIAQSRPTLCNPVDCSPSGSSVHGDSPGKSTGVGGHALLQGISPTRTPSLQMESSPSEPAGKPWKGSREWTNKEYAQI